ncbi:hypothetical protein [Rhizobium leguminosarum]|uniref:hypothetical protein n=1 Tax=Rhizobium leguminosarum TaxID=384 RepID=UPI002E153A10|nr:hypothetical protein U8Q02_37675 [Rhizobium leguminosarum]
MSGSTDAGAFEKAKVAFRRRNRPEHRHDRDWGRASRAYVSSARAKFDAGPTADAAIDLLAAAFDVGGLRSEEPSRSSVLAVARFHRERMQEIVAEGPGDDQPAGEVPASASNDAKQLRLIRELLEAHGHATRAEQAYSDAIAQRGWESHAFGELAKKNIVYAGRMREIQAWTTAESGSTNGAGESSAVARPAAKEKVRVSEPSLFG